jgi:phosphoribosylamine-glycine ligase
VESSCRSRVQSWVSPLSKQNPSERAVPIRGLLVAVLETQTVIGFPFRFGDPPTGSVLLVRSKFICLTLATVASARFNEELIFSQLCKSMQIR